MQPTTSTNSKWLGNCYCVPIMATAKKTKKVDTSNKYLYPDCPPELLALMREVYAKYTGYEVAAAIRCIRTELDNAALEEQLKQDSYDIASTLGTIE